MPPSTVRFAIRRVGRTPGRCLALREVDGSHHLLFVDGIILFPQIKQDAFCILTGRKAIGSVIHAVTSGLQATQAANFNDPGMMLDASNVGR